MLLIVLLCLAALIMALGVKSIRRDTLKLPFTSVKMGPLGPIEYKYPHVDIEMCPNYNLSKELRIWTPKWRSRSGKGQESSRDNKSGKLF